MQKLKDILAKVKAWVVRLWSEHKKTLVIAALLMGGAVLMVHNAVVLKHLKNAVDGVELPEISCGLVDDAEVDKE